MFDTYCFRGDEKGVNILFLGAVHGNEVAGTIAQREIINQINQGNIKLKKGQVTFIPCVNVEAQKKDVRFVDVNLNRIIKYHDNPKNNEEKIANKLITEINKCNVLLDLHSTHCEEDVEFAFIDYPTEENLKLLSVLPVEKALAGWPEIYKKNPNIDDFCTERYAYDRGKTGITIECGYHKAKKSVDVAQKAILNVLAFYGCIDNEIITKHPQVIVLDRFVIKKNEGKMLQNYKHMMPIIKNEVLARYDNGENIISPFDGYIIMPNHEAIIGSEWFYLGHADNSIINEIK
ncbi:MAG: hypothetical protein E7017_05535 [Alphaproteobacteria bacterium]|nr:hypothetical protein [Alphaproteobacteria bacterium]